MVNCALSNGNGGITAFLWTNIHTHTQLYSKNHSMEQIQNNQFVFFAFWGNIDTVNHNFFFLDIIIDINIAIVGKRSFQLTNA